MIPFAININIIGLIKHYTLKEISSSLNECFCDKILISCANFKKDI